MIRLFEETANYTNRRHSNNRDSNREGISKVVREGRNGREVVDYER